MESDALYRAIYNANFWKGAGFRTKRASVPVEDRERKYLNKQLESIYDTIGVKRDTMMSYIRNKYISQLSRYNQGDMIVSVETLKDRADKAHDRMVDNVVKEFAVLQLPWVESIKIPKKYTGDEIKEILKLEKGKRDPPEPEITRKDISIDKGEDIKKEMSIQECSFLDTDDYGKLLSDILEVCNEFPNERGTGIILDLIKKSNLI